MATVPVYDIEGKEKEKVVVPSSLLIDVRPDIIEKAVLAERSLRRQPYGSDPIAGQRSSAHYHGRRQTRQSMMNREMARMKRIHNQGYLNLTARVEPYATKGRRAHPPKVVKVWELKMNKKERLRALYSAIAATMDKNLVSARGHRIKDVPHIPVVLDDSAEKLNKTKDVIQLLGKLGMKEELERCSEKGVRAGKGKMRGRKYKKKKGPLVIIKEDHGFAKALRNIPGVDVVRAKELSVEMMAPGTHPGRLTIWTKSALVEFGGRHGK